ncbi:excalibur calcium-binding domain-containing protein [Dietzia sp. NPDC055340]
MLALCHKMRIILPRIRKWSSTRDLIDDQTLIRGGRSGCRSTDVRGSGSLRRRGVHRPLGGAGSGRRPGRGADPDGVRGRCSPATAVPARVGPPVHPGACSGPRARRRTRTRAGACRRSRPSAGPSGHVRRQLHRGPQARIAPIYRGQDAYRPALDRDNDGVACE